MMEFKLQNNCLLKKTKDKIEISIFREIINKLGISGKCFLIVDNRGSHFISNFMTLSEVLNSGIVSVESLYLNRKPYKSYSAIYIISGNESSIKKIIESMYKALPIEPNTEGVESQEYIYADYVINRKITGIERLETLKKIGEKWTVDLYTKDATVTAEGVRNHGIAQYYESMPYIFKCSDINLNISLRSIQKGIPLRCFDIMGVRGFLISNYQEDFLRFFEPGKDFVFYDSERDLMEKIGFYFDNPDKRMEIADNAYNKVKKDHTFDIRVGQILKEAGVTG